MNPSVSIITINFNNKVGLADTIESVLSQKKVEYQYLVIDGGSTDGSTDIIEKFETGIHYWISEKDSGIYNAMNKGIAKAKGDYLLFLNSGDYFSDSNVLSDFIFFQQSNPNASVIYGNYILKKHDGQTEPVEMPDTISLDWLMKGSIPHTSTFIRKELFDKFGYYDESLTIVSDWVFFLKIYAQSNSIFLHFKRSISFFNLGGISTKISNQNILNHERKIGISKVLSPAILKIIQDYHQLNNRWARLRLDSLFNLLKKLKSVGAKIQLPFSNFYKAVTFQYHSLYTRISYKKFKNQNIIFSKQIPIIINNRNRLTSLQTLIHGLTERGYNNIFIIDNASDYPPLLDYYGHSPYSIFKLDTNSGFCAIWDTNIFDSFKGQYYVYTDSDVTLDDSCSDDFLCFLLFLLHKHKKIDKAGLGLKISDLPDYYAFKNKVVSWEQSLIDGSELIEKDVYNASVDTTFALYRPDKIGPAGYLSSLRTYGKYQVKHLPWYIDLDNLSDEEQYYINHAHTKNYTYWTAVSKEHIKKIN